MRFVLHETKGEALDMFTGTRPAEYLGGVEPQCVECRAPLDVEHLQSFHDGSRINAVWNYEGSERWHLAHRAGLCLSATEVVAMSRGADR